MELKKAAEMRKDQMSGDHQRLALLKQISGSLLINWRQENSPKLVKNGKCDSQRCIWIFLIWMALVCGIFTLTL